VTVALLRPRVTERPSSYFDSSRPSDLLAQYPHVDFQDLSPRVFINHAPTNFVIILLAFHDLMIGAGSK